jgi:dTDP-4-amino-4,6-dideoxygalactose transaminase
LPGLNGKLNEVGALTALLQLRRFEAVVEHRRLLSEAYRRYLPDWTHQETCGKRQSYAFQSVLLKESLSPMRTRIVEVLRSCGIGASTYFSPHLIEQPYFAKHCVAGSLAVTQEISERILTLPMYDTMTESEVHDVASGLVDAIVQSTDESNSSNSIMVTAKGKKNDPSYVVTSFASDKS